MAFPNLVDLETDVDQDNRLFNFLLFLFPHYLKSAMRKGLYKEYISRRYNDGNVKGTIDIARQIRLNTPFTGNVAYTQREFSYDNALMELVRHTIEFIKHKPYGNKVLSKAKEEVNLVIGVTAKYEPYCRSKIVEQNKRNMIHGYLEYDTENYTWNENDLGYSVHAENVSGTALTACLPCQAVPALFGGCFLFCIGSFFLLSLKFTIDILAKM